MENKSEGLKLNEELSYEKKNFFEIASSEEIEQVFNYSKGYMQYLDDAKTEREAVKASIVIAEANGYTPYVLGEKLNKGDKKYYNNRGKSLVLMRIGNGNIAEDGIKILASHIDSPRLDIKQNPLYEDSGMAFLKTHYYGGVKKYQWTATPLALHGTVYLKNGNTVDLAIGEKDSDPVFYVNDILPHLGRELASKPLGSAIEGEMLNILVGGLPFKDKDVKDKIKLTVLNELNKTYGIVESDFLSAELCVVPSAKARDIGFDRSLIGAYGHDDRVCSYPALTATINAESDRYTIMTVLADKEEIGSEGNTGMQCQIYQDIINLISESLGVSSALVRSKSKCLSADVTAGYDPNFANVFEKRNSSLVSYGTAICKFTGAGGKSGSNDASAELMGYLRTVLDENNVCWQVAELGKVDAGGGGTVAKYIAKMNIDTVDIGVPVISMHAPYEVVSKADVWNTYKAFLAFVK